MNDIDRMQKEYEDRKHRLRGRNIYSWFNKANLFMLQQRQRAVLSILGIEGFTNLRNLSIFEMGCGSGGVLTEYLGFGASPKNLVGVDLLIDRLQDARNTLCTSGIIQADGQTLPFPAECFDLVLQSTAISSILSPVIRQNVCMEMLRVLKPEGMILSYDFWANPVNPQTRGLRPVEIKSLFPNCRYKFNKITLAPPITRKLAPVSWGLCHLLESLKIFNTHYLVAIRRAQYI